MSTIQATDPIADPDEGKKTSTLTSFQGSLRSVYGDLSPSVISNPETWIPPPRSGGHRGRYLWTDAFGVLNLITLHREASDLQDTIKHHYLILAKRLVETVHDVLGRTRDGRARLPGATDSNPVGGGLRIGKIDPDGPDADGQYHHYLTVWMFALNRLSLATDEPKYNQLAVALARAIHPRFMRNRESDRPRLAWKMRTDLSAPLVTSEGNLDPVDGFVVFRLLQATARAQCEREHDAVDGHGEGNILDDEIEDYRRIMRRKGEQFVSTDPLDLGMTLWTVHWFAEREEWAAAIAKSCINQMCKETTIIQAYRHPYLPTYYILDTLFEIDRYLQFPARYRLPFREFGTCLGICCHVEQQSEKQQHFIDLDGYADAILRFWEPIMELSAQGSDEDDLKAINKVMYASALIPGGEFAIV